MPIVRFKHWECIGKQQHVFTRQPQAHGSQSCKRDIILRLGRWILTAILHAETRGTLNCDLFQSYLGNIPGAAHCLRFDSLYYQVSQICSFVMNTTAYRSPHQNEQVMLGAYHNCYVN